MRDKVFLALLETSAAHANKSRQGFMRLNLSDGQPKILYILAGQEGCLQKELAEMCQIRQSTMTVMLEKLAEKDLIFKKKTLVSGGKGAFQIYLTDNGRIMAEKVIRLMEELESISMKGFTREEKILFLSMLGRVTENLNHS